MSQQLYSSPEPSPLPSPVQAVLGALGAMGDRVAIDQMPEAHGLFLDGSCLWLAVSFVDWADGQVPRLTALHPDAIQRMFFSMHVWSMRSRLLSDNLGSYLEAQSFLSLPILVGESCPEAAPVIGQGNSISNSDGDGVASAPTDTEPGGILLHQPLLRRLRLDPIPARNRGLRRGARQMLQNLPYFGATGLAALEVLRRWIGEASARRDAKAGLSLGRAVRHASAPEDPSMYRSIQAQALRRRAVDGSEDDRLQDHLSQAAELYDASAALWRCLALGDLGLDQVDRLLGELQNLESRAVELCLESPSGCRPEVRPGAEP